jgi:metal-responsive CopG/Arc/MetJ family transcriptional regulator
MSNLQIKEANEKYIGFSTTPSMVDYIERLSEENNTSRSEIIRAIIRTFQQNDAQQK